MARYVISGDRGRLDENQPNSTHGTTPKMDEVKIISETVVRRIHAHGRPPGRVMGTTVIGGILAATLLAIFLIPVTYYVVERFAANRRQGAPHSVSSAIQSHPRGR